MLSNLKKSLLVLSTLTLLSTSAMAEEMVKEIEKPQLFSVCETCHGIGGVSTMSGYPTLAGQDKAYIISSIKAYQAGQRTGGLSALMIPMSNMFVDDKSIEEMAEYLHNLK